MPIAAHQFSVRDLLWFLFGAGAFFSGWTTHSPLGGLTSAALLAVFYWRVGARDVLVLHCHCLVMGLIPAAIVMSTLALGMNWPLAAAPAWWSIQAAALMSTLVSFTLYLLSLLARQF